MRETIFLFSHFILGSSMFSDRNHFKLKVDNQVINYLFCTIFTWVHSFLYTKSVTFVLFEISCGWHIPHFKVSFPKMDIQIFRVTNQNAITVLLFLCALPDWIDPSLSWAPQLTVFSFFHFLLVQYCTVSCVESVLGPPPTIFTSYRWGSCVIGVGETVVWGGNQSLWQGDPRGN